MAVFEKYGLRFGSADLVKIEMAMIRKGGQWKGSNGQTFGNGLEFHYKALISALWPHWQWQKWSDVLIKEFSENWLTAVMGPASSGKTGSGAVFALADYFTFPNNTGWLISSTTMDGLDRRVWGEIKKRFREAKARHPWLPGNIIDSKKMLLTERIEEDGDVRDVRNGILCIACLQGGSYVGLGGYAGFKNDRVRHLADELQFMPAAFVDAISNLAKNDDFKVVGFGNPKDRTDALGKLAEPSDEYGGWDAVPDTGKTQIWETRFRHERRGRGRCVQLDGRDTPNADYPKGLNPYRYLIKPEDIATDIAFYGGDSVQVAMMDYGRMPKDAQSKRVITRVICERGRAFEEAVFESEKDIVKIGCLDAAYSGTGGDRTALMEIWMGKELNGGRILAVQGNPTIVPVSDRSSMDPPEQIVLFTKAWCEERGILPSHFFFDGTGRSSLTSAYGRLWSPSVVPIEFGGKATTRPLGKIADCSKKYHKMVSELWFASRELITGSQLRQLPTSVFEEGILRGWDLFPGGFEDVEPKEKMKERLGRSPDLYDAFVAGVEGARRLGFVIATKSFVEQKSGHDWLRKEKERYRTMNASKYLEEEYA